MNTVTKRSISSMAAIAAALCLASLVAGCSMMTKPANTGIADADITSGVNAGLAAESRFDDHKINVTTADGVVHLSGNVPTAGDRDSAETIAAASRGVVRVDNYIQFGHTTTVVQ